MKLAKMKALRAKLSDCVYEVIGGLSAEVYHSEEPLPFGKRFEGKYSKLNIGDVWGKLFDCGWFNFKGTLPASAKGKKVLLLIDISGEGLVVDNDGNPVRGLTFKASSPYFKLGTQGKCQVPVSDSANGGEIIDIWVDGGCNSLFGKKIEGGALKTAAIAVEHTEIKELYFDIEILESLFDSLKDEKDAEYKNTIGNAVNLAVKAVLNGTLTDGKAKEIRASLKPYLDAKNTGDTMLVYAIGHAHIDLAWLWPERETYRKGARTFSTQLQLIEEYPEYKFGASQAQLYLWMKEKYPQLYERIKQSARDGKWEVQGAMWVEPDSNLLGGESLVRQVMYGKAFFMREFGQRMDIMWVPDSFGYSGALPQILKKSNIPYFMTQKMSWNRFNEFPYHTFIWRGIDGSDVLTHMLPDNTYNSVLTPSSLASSRTRYKQKEVSNEYLYLFGIGDGGGGPGIEHVERMKRCRDLKGLPKVEGAFAIDFFKRLEENREKYPVHNGELYLEKHQGCYTSQARNKLNNRKIELELRECEYALTLASMFAGEEYTPETLLEIWQNVLLYHFHDILPGSSIKRVYDESVPTYLKRRQEVREITEKAYSAAAKALGLCGAVVFNSLSFDRNDYVKKDGVWYRPAVKAASLALLSEKNAVNYASKIAAKRTLENEHIKVLFNSNGTIRSLFDKASGTEFAEKGKGLNRFNLWRDFGNAWDMFPTFYFKRFIPKTAKLLSVSFENDGPSGKQIMTYRVGKSQITQEVILMADERAVKFKTKVDWRETMRMLRVKFPVNIVSDKVKYNIQFGYLERATTHKDSIERAQTETSGQKWVDINDGKKGLTLITDSKYGYRNWDNVLDLNLLRSTITPGRAADKGEQFFEYTIKPYIGGFDKSEAFKEGYIHNIPLTVLDAEKTGENAETIPEAFFNKDNDDIIFENVKRAESGEGYVVRLFNSTPSEQKTEIKFNNGLKISAITDLEENVLQEINDDKTRLSFGKFEIISLLVK